MVLVLRRTGQPLGGRCKSTTPKARFQEFSDDKRRQFNAMIEDSGSKRVVVAVRRQWLWEGRGRNPAATTDLNPQSAPTIINPGGKLVNDSR